MKIEDRLLRIKKRIEKAKSDKERAEGRKLELMRRLKENFKCSSTHSAHKKLLKINQQIEKLRKELEKGVKNIEENYEI